MFLGVETSVVRPSVVNDAIPERSHSVPPGVTASRSIHAEMWSERSGVDRGFCVSLSFVQHGGKSLHDLKTSNRRFA
jgi:hypothetical protein